VSKEIIGGMVGYRVPPVNVTPPFRDLGLLIPSKRLYPTKIVGVWLLRRSKENSHRRDGIVSDLVT
jgi:hypothetical protein